MLTRKELDRSNGEENEGARVKRRFDTKGTRPLRCLGEENGDARSRNIDGDHGHSYKNVSMGKNISIGMVISQKRRHG